jgi:S-DNA-T family DNA segregation ATPase FtsK/SpoIIIE
MTRCRNNLPALTASEKSAECIMYRQLLRVTTLVPPRDAAHHTARYGTIKLLWLFGHSQDAGSATPAGGRLDRVHTPLMKPQRLMYSPTRSRRLNEMLGLIVLVVAGLLLLALVSYTPSDPSFNSVGDGAGTHLAHNWTGLVGAYSADLLLQTLGIAIFFVPLALLRIGLSWIRSQRVGSTKAKVAGILLWLIFAPALIALMPGEMLWRHALPISGIEGTILAGGLIHFVNYPGAMILCGLMVALSLYLTTTFLLANAGSWFTAHFGFIRSLSDRYAAWKSKRRGAADEEFDEAFASKREIAAAMARKQEAGEGDAARNGSLLSSFFGWFGRRNRKQEDESDATVSQGPEVNDEPASVWQTMPRTLVDAAPMTGLHVAAAAAAPYAAQLAAAAAPLRSAQAAGAVETPSAAEVEDDGWLNAPERRTPPPILAMPKASHVAMPEPPPARIPTLKPVQTVGLPPMPSPMQDIAAQNIAFGKRADADQRAVAITPKSVRGYKLPPSSLLYKSEEHAQVRENELREEARVLVEKCGEFGVDGSVEQINPGPVVTTFEFRPDAGVKYSRVTGLADDLCLAMAAESILIERMPGKSTVGIQVPNHERETIWLRDVVECENFAQSKSKLAIALGKDISGRIVIGDLASMPHVLIAGSTGSGKSVAINAMIMSVLFKSTPEQVRMILVDPKRVELGMYEGIPHLFTPIITEAKLAANALRNAVREMERRLKLLAANHVRNIDQFNKLFENGSEYLFADVNQEPLPYIMIIIDELADLMMLDRANVEEAITRLAQMARAVGIHLVLATQRPSVDVITGLIKANVPTRMSFRLATKVDSRTIIDSNGAESLLGRGDMLFLPPGTSRLQRVHAPFVTEKEIAAVTEFWKAQGEAEYVHGFLEGPKDEKSSEGGSSGDGEEDDALFDDAVRLVFEFGKASTSLLQRRLRIGYGRAAHLIDMMERDGLVGPADGSKPREILKSPSYFSEVDASTR